MFARRFAVALVLVLLPLHAHAQLDDLLTPLTAEPPSKRAPGATKKKATRKPPPQKAQPEVQLTPLVTEGAALVVKVSGPDDAEVLVNGRSVREGSPVELEPGEHRVIVRRPGYAEVRRSVRLKKKGTTTLPVALVATAGVLAATSDVPGSRVSVDGKVVGNTPLEGLLLDPGVRDVVVHREGFEEHRLRIVVRPGRDYTVRGTLRPLSEPEPAVAHAADRPQRPRLTPTELPPEGISFTPPSRVEPDPLHKRWYVWAGAGAIAAAAITSAVLVSKGPGSPGLRPEDVCGGPCDGVLPLPGFGF
jgi:hypothetical protein